MFYLNRFYALGPSMLVIGLLFLLLSLKYHVIMFTLGIILVTMGMLVRITKYSKMHIYDFVKLYKIELSQNDQLNIVTSPITNYITIESGYCIGNINNKSYVLIRSYGGLGDVIDSPIKCSELNEVLNNYEI